MKTRKKHCTVFKAKGVIVNIKEVETHSELAKRFDERKHSKLFSRLNISYLGS